MNRKLLNFTVFSALCSLSMASLTACENPEIVKSNDLARERIWKGEKSHIVRYPWQEKLPANALNSDADTLKRILSMTNEERGHRLPSFVINNNNKIIFNRGSNRKLQEATNLYHTDTKGNFRFLQKIGRDDVEYILQDGNLYVRYVNGPFRVKESLNQPIDLLRELSAKSIWDSFAPWFKYLKLSSHELSTHAGRTGYQYQLSLRKMDDNEKPAISGDGATDGDSWRDHIWPTDIKGQIIVDSESSVLLAAHLEIQADITDGSVQPTTLQYTFDSGMDQVLKAPAVEVPSEFIQEYTVVKAFRGGKYQPKSAAETASESTNSEGKK